VKPGIGYRQPHRDALLTGEPRDIVLEIVPDHFFGEPAAIEPLAARYSLVFHDVALSIATDGDGALARARLARLRELVARARPVLFSDHLALTRGPSGIDLGHLAPVWLVPEVLDLVVDRVRAVQDVLGVPIALENISTPFAIPGAMMSEPEFFARLVDRTGCGMLLDLTNVLIDSRNHGFDPLVRVREYPLTAVRQIHLAGGHRGRDQIWVDSHSRPVDDASYALLGEIARSRLPVVTIVVERDHHLDSLDALIAEARRGADVWEARCP
jgi:uncharacterized protein (UPF0276 family)